MPDPDYISSARRLVRWMTKKNLGGRIANDPEELESAALFAVGRLAVRHDPSLCTWNSYVYNYGLFALLDELRRSQYVQRGERVERSGPTPTSVLMGEMVAQDEVDPTKAVDDADELEHYLSMLSERDRRMLVGKYMEGRTRDEIATAEGISKTWASYKIDKALRKLRERMRVA